MTTATAIAPVTLLRIERTEMVRVLHEEKLFSEVFVSYLLARNARIQEDLVDQLFIPVKSAWPGPSCCSRNSARKARQKY